MDGLDPCTHIGYLNLHKYVVGLDPYIYIYIYIYMTHARQWWNQRGPNTPVTSNLFLLRSSKRAQTVCKLPEYGTNYLNVVQTI